MRAAIYVRVSTAGKTKQGDALTFVQNPEVQEQPLRNLIEQRGSTLHKVYSDRASGSAERRPGLDALMADAKRGLFQILRDGSRLIPAQASGDVLLSRDIEIGVQLLLLVRVILLAPEESPPVHFCCS